MAGRSYRELAGAVIVLAYMLAIPAAIALTWSPARGDGALVVWEPGLIIRSAGPGPGGPWLVGTLTGNETGTLVAIGGEAIVVAGLVRSVGCWTPWGLAVVGQEGRDKVVLFVDGGRVVGELRLEIGVSPRWCSYGSGVLAALFGDPVVWSYLLVYNGSGGVLVRLNGLPGMPSRLAVLAPDRFAVTGNGFLAIVELEDGEASIRVFNVSVAGKRPAGLGVFPVGGEPGLFGYVPGERERGFVYVPGEGWLVVEPVREDRSTRVRGAVQLPDGTVRLIVEVVGRETSIVDLRGGESRVSHKLAVLAPYILRGVYSWPGQGFGVTGEIFPRFGNETRRAKIAVGLVSNAAFSLARSPGDAVAFTSSGTLFPVRSLEEAGLEPAGEAMGKARPVGPAGEPSVEWGPAGFGVDVYTVYVDRALLFCALLAVTSLLLGPVAASVWAYWSRRM